MATSAFHFPAFHAFPPSYTRQPVRATREKQVSLWCDLMLAFCKHRGDFWVDMAEITQSELFVNAAINRRMKGEDVVFLFDELVNRGDAQWDVQGAGKTRCLVFWRSPAEWGDLVYTYIDRTGQNNSVMTLYELRCSDMTKGEPFHNLDLDLMLLALQSLELANKAAIFEGAKSDQLGVKFL
ncbi:Vacuolar protein-sorting-associated protein 25 [Porphyridium purpureum]|uniref:ESCRT-II complex subunit VPS25 n=1 Tax=Porphyridium purpureum TaxID=35688 RepID=A0A5J4YWD2_PORPP|nr:Vacuolar protein-sorting-associated protein 25 [Porphyridium purpureum]|eukprot:POR9534..scf227_4